MSNLLILASAGITAAASWLFIAGPMRTPLDESDVARRLRFLGKPEKAALLDLAVTDRAKALVMKSVPILDMPESLGEVSIALENEIDERCADAKVVLPSFYVREAVRWSFWEKMKDQVLASHFDRVPRPNAAEYKEAAEKLKFQHEWREMYDWYIEAYPNRSSDRDEWTGDFMKEEAKLMKKYGLRDWYRPVNIHAAPQFIDRIDGCFK